MNPKQAKQRMALQYVRQKQFGGEKAFGADTGKVKHNHFNTLLGSWEEYAPALPPGGMEVFPCTHCGLTIDRHANFQCLFAPTRFKARSKKEQRRERPRVVYYVLPFDGTVYCINY